MTNITNLQISEIIQLTLYTKPRKEKKKFSHKSGPINMGL